MEFELPDSGWTQGREGRRKEKSKGVQRRRRHDRPVAGVRVKFSLDCWSRNNPENSNSSVWEAQLRKVGSLALEN